MRRRQFSSRLATGALAGLLPIRSFARDAYPARPLRLVVPFAPGGTTDVVARIVGNALTAELAQPIVIDNKGGAGGTLGADAVAKSMPDGYTLLLFHIGMVYATALYKTLPYDTVKDLMPISLVGDAPSVLVVSPSMPVNSVAEFNAYAKAHPGTINYGSAGIGTSAHLAAELYQLQTGLRFTHIPYRGGGPAITALMGGEIQFMIETAGTLMPLIKGGKVKALAVTDGKRTPSLPAVPTMREAGLPDYVYTTWYGLFAPAKTPAPVADRLSAAVRTLLANDEVRARLDQAGIEPRYTSSEQFAAIIQSDLKLWGGLIRKAGIETQ